MKYLNRQNLLWVVFVFMCAGFLGFLTISMPLRAYGIDFFVENGWQYKLHRAVLEGHAGSPWQYRILATYLVELTIRLFRNFPFLHPVALAFLSFRLVQDVSIFLLTYIYIRNLKIPRFHAVFGMAIMAWMMSYAYYGSDLQFNTYFDVIFYLLSGICIILGKIFWIIPIMILAAFNRETSGVIPFLILGASLAVKTKKEKQKYYYVFILVLFIYVVAFWGLRHIYGYQGIITAHGHKPGVDLLRYNLSRFMTLWQFIATFNIIPVLAFIGYRRWPYLLKIFFWVVVPIWAGVHAFAGVWAETRLFLVPLVLIFIPGALYTLVHEASTLDVLKKS